MRVGDLVTKEHAGQAGRGRVEGVRDGRALVRLSIHFPEPWTSPLNGGIVPTGCPVTYLLWLPIDELTPVN